MRCKTVKRALTSFLHTSVDTGWVVFFDIILSLPENNCQCCIGQARLYIVVQFTGNGKKSALEVFTCLPAKKAVVISAAMIWHFSMSCHECLFHDVNTCHDMKFYLIMKKPKNFEQ